VTLNDRIHELVSEDWGGSRCAPPGSTQKLYVLEKNPKMTFTLRDFENAEKERERGNGVVYVFSALDEGSSVGIGYLDNWHVILSVPTTMRLAWFVLWTVWVKATWFGLKRFIYFNTLHRMVEGWKKSEEGTRGSS